MDGNDPTVQRQGRRRLRDWLPAARARVKRGAGQAHLGSSIAKAMEPHVREDNFQALVIYPAPRGGWHCDLQFRKMPPGVSNTLGTPVGSPCATFAAAEEHGRGLLATCLAIEAQHALKAAQTPPPPPAFVVDGHAVELSARFYEKLLEALGGKLPPFVDRAYAVRRLEDVMEQHLPRGFTAAAMHALPNEDRLAVFSAMHICALVGVFRYPLLVDGVPESPGRSSDAVH